MKLLTASLLAPAVALAACASYPAPIQRLADAEAASRSAMELGTSASPKAQLHVTMAREEIATAKKLMNDGDNEKADYTLLRAKGDADLALELTRETAAEAAAAQAAQEMATLRPPSQSTSTTTTTSATTTTQTTNGGTP